MAFTPVCVLSDWQGNSQCRVWIIDAATIFTNICICCWQKGHAHQQGGKASSSDQDDFDTTFAHPVDLSQSFDRNDALQIRYRMPIYVSVKHKCGLQHVANAKEEVWRIVLMCIPDGLLLWGAA